VSERPLRVAHLDTGIGWRGGQAQVALLMRGLASRGIANLLLAPESALSVRATETGIPWRPWAPRGDLSLPSVIRAWQLLHAFGADLAHCHTARAHALGAPAARAAGAAVVVSRRVALPVRGGLAGLKYRMPVDGYLCVSRSVMEAMVKGGVPRERLRLVHSGIEPGPFTSRDLRQEIGVSAETPIIGVSASFTAEKRHRDLVDAMRHVHAARTDVHMVWLGEGPLREELERRRDLLGLTGHIHVLGFMADARARIAQCTIASLASDSEGIATTLIEAQADGVPVVATAVGGIPEVVRDGVTGRLVPARSPQSLAAAFLELLGDPTLRASMAAAARQAGAEFHIDRTVERTLDAYLWALGRAPLPA
jgi:glycosyltransferase involved in cell wall biosynthesis